AAMRCAACGHVNSAKAKFCEECGTRVAVICPTCGSLAAPRAKFCEECGTRLARLCPTCSGLASPAARFCPECGAALGEVPGAGPARHPAPGTRHPPDEGDRRLVTVLFADVTGSTVMGERLDPEEITEIMNRGFDRLVAAVHAYGGTIGRFMGDGMLALFGARVAHEHDPEQAISAAQRMQATVVEYREQVRRRWGVEYQIRVGINTGMVVASRV